MLRAALEREPFAVRGMKTYAFNPVIILQDLKNRGRGELAAGDTTADQDVTLRLKESPVVHVQRLAERALDLFALGDVVAACAAAKGGRTPRPGSPSAGVVPGPAVRRRADRWS